MKFAQTILISGVLLFALIIGAKATVFAIPPYPVDSLRQLILDYPDGELALFANNELGWQFKNAKPDSSLYYGKTGLQLAQKLNDNKAASLSLNIIGIYYKNRGILDSAVSYFEQSLSLRKKEGDSISLARSYINLGNLYRKQGAFEQSTTYYEAAVALLYGSRDDREMAKVENALGLALLEMGEMSKALGHIATGKKIRERLADTLGIANSLTSLGNYYETTDFYDKAFENYQAAFELYELQEDLPGQAKSLNNLGNIAQTLEKLSLAEKFYQNSLEINQRLGFVLEEADTRSNLGTLYEQTGKMAEALQQFRTSFYVHQHRGDRYGIINGLAHIGHALRVTGALDASLDTLLLAYRLSDSTEVPFIRMQLCRDLSEVYAKKENYFQAYRYNQEIQDITKRLAESKTEAFNRIFNLQTDEIENQKRERLSAMVVLAQERTQRTQQLLIAALAGILLLTLLFFSRRRIYRQKIRINQAEKEAEKRKHKALEAEQRAELHRNELELERQKKELEQRELEQKLQEQRIHTMDALLEGQTRERTRIAQDLHDRLGSVLAVLKIHLDEAFDSVSLSKIAQQNEGVRIERVNSLIDEASETVREISNNLRAGTLDRFGLIPAIDELCNRIRETQKISVELHHETIRSAFPPDIEWTIYQIVEEALNNVLKHAEASKVTIQLFKGQERLTVSIEDNGKGFDAQHQFEGGMGLPGMQIRVAKQQGTLTIDSNPGHGTTIMIIFPLLPTNIADESKHH